MTLPTFNRLLQLVKPHLAKRSCALPAELRLAVTLRFLATGDLTVSIALAFRIGESTTRNIIKEVYLVLTRVLTPQYLQCPSEEQWNNIANGFWETWNVPNCYGAVDGKHLLCQCPPNSGSLFYNYKKTFSIVLMAVSDHLSRFTLVDIGAYGGNSDGGIFADSDIGINLKNENLNLSKESLQLPRSNIRMPGFFLADDAFELSTRIMKPYSGRCLEEKKKICNYRFSRGRRIIENAFGIYSSRWRIFRRPICMLPKTVDIIASSTVCLHNFLMQNEECSGTKVYSMQPSQADTVNPHWSPMPSSNNDNTIVLGRQRNVAQAIRQRELLTDYFLTAEGEVLWQYEYVRRGQYGDVD